MLPRIRVFSLSLSLLLLTWTQTFGTCVEMTAGVTLVFLQWSMFTLMFVSLVSSPTL